MLYEVITRATSSPKIAGNRLRSAPTSRAAHPGRAGGKPAAPGGWAGISYPFPGASRRQRPRADLPARAASDKFRGAGFCRPSYNFV